MKQYLLFIFCVFTLLQANAQIDLSTHFMNNLAQQNATNPSTFSDYKVSVSLPSLYVGLNNSSFAPSNVLEKRGDDYYLDMEGVMSRVGESGMNVQTNLNVETFGFSVRGKKWQASFNHGIKVNSFHHIPKKLLEFAWQGNAQFIGETVNVAPVQNLMAYQEFGLGFAYQVSKQLNFGVRLKYLVGSANYSTSNAKATIYTDPEYYQLTAETDYVINTAGIPEQEMSGDDFFNFDNFEPNLFGGNQGFAIDFGASLKLTEKINVQTSILNIGKINWSDTAYNYTSNGTSTFDGLDFQPVINGGDLVLEEVVDSLTGNFDFETSQNSFSTVLPSSFYLSGTYQLNSSLSAGALFFAQGFQSELTTAFAVNIKKDFGRVFSLGAQYAFVEGGAQNFGVSTTLKLGPVQIFATTDNVMPIFNPLKGQNTNLRVGMNLVFGKMDTKDSGPKMEMTNEPAEIKLKD